MTGARSHRCATRRRRADANARLAVTLFALAALACDPRPASEAPTTAPPPAPTGLRLLADGTAWFVTGLSEDAVALAAQGHLFVAMRPIAGTGDQQPVAVLVAVAPPEGATIHVTPQCVARGVELASEMAVAPIQAATQRKVGRCFARIIEVGRREAGEYVRLDVGAGLEVAPGDTYALLGEAVTADGYVPLGLDTTRDGLCRVSTQPEELEEGSAICWVVTRPGGRKPMKGAFAMWRSASACPPGSQPFTSSGAALCMATSETTVLDYRACVDANACTGPGTRETCNGALAGREQHPINCVSLAQATAHCTWRGGRLPTALEWEDAAWAGDRSRTYPWGDAAPDCTLATFQEPGAKDGCDHEGTTPVGTHPRGANPLGLVDLAGNVREWTATQRGDVVVTKGGGWTDTKIEVLGIALESTSLPDQAPRNLGFRCVWEVP